MQITRRNLIQAGVLGATAVGLGAFRAREAAAADAGPYAAVFPALDAFAEQFLREMNAPGMTLVLADREAVRRVVTYGYGDLEARRRVREDELFQIGSISKSFVALALLQLRDEGKLDLQRPIVEYLPWMRIDSTFAPITVHHLLTHTTGLPGAGDIFQWDPELAHLAAYAPGEHFHYNNAMYDLLGILAWTLDGRELPELLRERILRPVGMGSSEPVITADIRERLARNYSPFLADRPFPRDGRLSEAPFVFATGGAGSIAATAADMGQYVRMIANHGQLGAARLLSEDGFTRFSSPQIEAAAFGPGAHYGYGIAVDTLDGNRLLRHTGGMVSFMSALMVDIDDGVGAFASINAQQGYRAEPDRALRPPAHARAEESRVTAGHAGTGPASGRRERRGLRRHVSRRVRARSRWWPTATGSPSCATASASRSSGRGRRTGSWYVTAPSTGSCCSSAARTRRWRKAKSSRPPGVPIGTATRSTPGRTRSATPKSGMRTSDTTATRAPGSAATGS